MTIVNQYPIMAQRAPEWVILLFLGCLTICCYIFIDETRPKNQIINVLFGWPDYEYYFYIPEGSITDG